MTATVAEAERPGEEEARAERVSVRSVVRRAWHFFLSQTFSSLTRRIVFLNVAGLLALVMGILYLSQFRAGLIEARIQSLLVQGEIIAGAIAASATVETNTITVSPERLMELPPGQSYGPADDGFSVIDFSINPERVGPLLQRLVSPTRTRARVYDRDGSLVVDTRLFDRAGDVFRADLPPVAGQRQGFFERAWIAFRAWFGRGDLPLYRELAPENGRGYPEVEKALNGLNAWMVRVNDRGEVIISVAVPVKRFSAVRGALLFSTQRGDIDQMVEAERLAVFKVFLVAAAVMVVLSVFLAGTIADPVRRLAAGAESVRRRIRSRVEIPDFTERRDEIGHLSGALREMTNALYTRIEAIESFAADVAHELRNPLTSLRSAVETLPLAKSDHSRARLLAVIEHDVRRLDRLISDVSDASRLDAELQRQEAAPVDLVKLLTTVVTVANEVPGENNVHATLTCEGDSRTLTVPGHDSRLAQVFNNLIDNARSFSPEGGTVRIACRRRRDQVTIVVDDDGPGIRSDALEKIFDRFYTDRPDQGFGQNSGLGLSISRQIIEAHGGRIRAENRVGLAPDGTGETRVLGARFVIRLPAM
ncbi:MAG TPA: sensor histidine kinase [Xanthobacteraceae bacterium]|nr:sensor histidine kinase [Xanthobacteraceae bacterium]